MLRDIIYIYAWVKFIFTQFYIEMDTYAHVSFCHGWRTKIRHGKGCTLVLACAVQKCTMQVGSSSWNGLF
jgi:hypothetical protein